jgi:hypothetical protein
VYEPEVQRSYGECAEGYGYRLSVHGMVSTVKLAIYSSDAHLENQAEPGLWADSELDGMMYSLMRLVGHGELKTFM